MAKILTSRGMEDLPEGIDSVEDRELPTRQPKPAQQPSVQVNCNPMPVPEKKKVIREYNEDPDAKRKGIGAYDRNGEVPISKTFIYVSIIAIILIFTGLGIWFGIDFHNKSFSSNINTTVMPAQITTPITNQNNFTIQNTQPNVTIINQVAISDEIANQIANKTICIVRNQLNNTNVTC